MTNILLTGLPRVGKTDLISATTVFSEEKYGKTVENVSLGGIIAENAGHLWGTAAEDRPLIGQLHHAALRTSVIPEAVLKVRDTTSDHIIIDTPMTFYLDGMIPDIIFSQHQIGRLHEAARIDHVVTLIDDPLSIAKNLEQTPYPTDPNKILNWMAWEVSASSNLGPHHARKLAIPRDHSEQTLTKLLNDDNPVVTYVGMPITHMKQDEGAMEQVYGFVENLKAFTSVVVPMISHDSRVSDPLEKASVVHRDVHWFVRQGDFMVAYFPKDVKSTGVAVEMRNMMYMGKPGVIIHPKCGDDGEVFGVRPTLQYRTGDEFFEAVLGSGDPKYNDKPERKLRRFLNDNLDGPRYDLFSETS